MTYRFVPTVVACCLLLALFVLSVSAEAQQAAGNQEQLTAHYTATLNGLSKELAAVLPKVPERELAALSAAEATVKKASADEDSAAQALGKIAAAKGLIEHAKGKWIGGAEKGIAAAEAAIKKAANDTERSKAQAELTKWQANKADGIKALNERQAAYDQLRVNEPQLKEKHQTAKQALDTARATQAKAVQALLTAVKPFLTSNQHDAKLAKAAIIATATPRGLAEFAAKSNDRRKLIDNLLGNDRLMLQMLEAGGASFGNFGPAIEIYVAIFKNHPKAREGHLQRLAMAVSLEHAKPLIIPGKAAGETSVTIDPVKRYQHYEQAWIDGELDPAFERFSVWEYRMVVDCDAPDDVLAWGRAMLRNYRPDHITNPDYGWRYSGIVRTDVSYGSENVHCDLSSLHNYQNIIKNGGVCGRRAFFGRFILKSFGIPTWGVTQHKHAALSHWTPKGWVVNLGAGFEHSWWDKDEAARSGSDFLLETQARAHTNDYMSVLRAGWISRVLNEQQYNDRKSIAGGIWSRVAHYQTVALASTAVKLGPLGQNLGEANESAAVKAAAVSKAAVTENDKKIIVQPNGGIKIPAAACTGSPITKSIPTGHQLFCGPNGKFQCEFEVARGGKYTLAARVVTVHDQVNLKVNANNSPQGIDLLIPYTIGQWQLTEPIEVTLTAGRNRLSFSQPARSFALQELILIPIK